MSTFIIACGGTGGHLSPGIATAQELTLRGHKCILIVSQKQIDEKLIQSYPDLEFFKFPGIGFSLRPWRWPSFILHQIQNFTKALKLIKETKAEAIIGFGGFLTTGIVFAGFLLSRPCILHEANHIPGKAVRLLHSIATRVYLPEGVEFKSRKTNKVKHCGFPIRKEVQKILQSEARQKLRLAPNQPVILVIGGSQGAKVFNQWVIENFEELGKIGINVLCVTGIGKGSEGKIEEKHPNGTITQVHFIPFYSRMNELFCAADIVIGRSGAGTIAELIQCETPSILVPYPSAADNHQYANALSLEKRGGCVVLPQKDIKTLTQEALKMLSNSELLSQMRYNLKQLKRYDAAEFMVSDIELLCKKPSKTDFSDFCSGF